MATPGKLAAQLVGAAVECAGASQGIPGLGGLAETLVENLLQVQDEQAESLRRIERNVQILIDAPWRAARIHLEECVLPGRTPAQARVSLSKAADLLRDALGRQSAGTLSAAYVALDLAIVLLLLNDSELGRHYARLAIEASTEQVLHASREEVSTAGLEWYWIANAVEPVCGWPWDQLERIKQGPQWAINAVEGAAAIAWRQGEVHSGWAPSGALDGWADYMGE